MKRGTLALLLLLFATGCASNFTPSATSPRFYNGTACVGDFLTITLNPVAHTLKYTNLSNTFQSGHGNDRLHREL